jgi:hypothetical protein
MPGQAGAVRTQLMVSRIASRLGLQEATVWARLGELRQGRRAPAQRPPPRPAPRQAPAPPEERQLLEVLLADEALVPSAAAEVKPEEIRHPGLRRLLQGLYALQAEGQPATLDLLRTRLAPDDAIAGHALTLQDVGRAHPDRPTWLRQLLDFFRERRLRVVKQELKNRLHAATGAAALELLRQLQDRSA